MLLHYNNYNNWEELTHWKRPWCWERLKEGGEENDRRWDGWMASLTQWTWVWASSGSWWWTGRPGMLQSMGSQSQTRLSDWTEMNWTDWHNFELARFTIVFWLWFQDSSIRKNSQLFSIIKIWCLSASDFLFTS